MKSDRIRNWPEEERPLERRLADVAGQLPEAELRTLLLCASQAI
jgi:hypothetical protein